MRINPAVRWIKPKSPEENGFGSEVYICSEGKELRCASSGNQFGGQFGPKQRGHFHRNTHLTKLRQFQKYLASIDEWNARPANIVIAEKDDLIHNQKQEIEKLSAKLAELNEYEVSLKILIDDGHLPTFIDIIQQLREAQLPSGRKLLKSDHKIAYAKMIAKYFSHGGKDIPIETARNYFVDKKGDVPIKGTSIQPEHRLFKVMPIEPSKK